MLLAHEYPIGSTSGASGMACAIAGAVLEMDGMAMLLEGLRRDPRGGYDPATFAADVARRIDLELRTINA